MRDSDVGLEQGVARCLRNEGEKNSWPVEVCLDQATKFGGRVGDDGNRSMGAESVKRKWSVVNTLGCEGEKKGKAGANERLRRLKWEGESKEEADASLKGKGAMRDSRSRAAFARVFSRVRDWRCGLQLRRVSQGSRRFARAAQPLKAVSRAYDGIGYQQT